MWQRFTQEARKVVFYAQEEAQAEKVNYVAPRHFLRAFYKEKCLATDILESLGITKTALLDLLDNQPIVEESYAVDPDIGFTLTPLGKQMIDTTWEEAKGLGHEHIGTEHLLLALARVEDGVASVVLKRAGFYTEGGRAVIGKLEYKD